MGIEKATGAGMRRARAQFFEHAEVGIHAAPPVRRQGWPDIKAASSANAACRHCPFVAVDRYLWHNSLVGAPDDFAVLQIVLMLILIVAKWIVFAHVIMSWLINFNVLNLRQPLVSTRSGTG